MKKAIVISSNLRTDRPILDEVLGPLVTIELTCSTIDVAINNFSRVNVDFIYIDMNLPDIDKIEEIDFHVKAFNPTILIVEYDLSKDTPIIKIHQESKNCIDNDEALPLKV